MKFHSLRVDEKEKNSDVPFKPISLPALLTSFLKIGAIGFGGGMAVIALMEREFVRERAVIDNRKFLDGVALGQVLGPFAVNTAIFVGFQLYGWMGAILCAGAFLLPSVILVIGLSWLYFAYHTIPALQGFFEGIGPVVIALILSAAWFMGGRAIKSVYSVILAVAGFVAGICKVNPIYALLSAGVVGLFLRKDRLRMEPHLPSPPVGRETKQKPTKAWPQGSLLPFIAATTNAAGVSLAHLGLVFMSVGFVFFGGGFVLIPILHQKLVVDLGWLTPRQFLDGVAISNLTPGPIAVLATFVGYHLQGVTGAVVATLALFAPAAALMLGLSYGYGRFHQGSRVQDFMAGVSPAVIGLILSAAFLLGRGALGSWRAYVLSVLSLALLVKWKWHPAFVLALGAAAGVAGWLR